MNTQASNSEKRPLQEGRNPPPPGERPKASPSPQIHGYNPTPPGERPKASPSPPKK
jgi:hypothetical protein